MTSDALPPLLRGQVIVTLNGDIHGEDTAESRELSRRIKVCINACDGISTEELEQGIVHDMCRVLTQVAPLLEAKVRGGKSDEKAA